VIASIIVDNYLKNRKKSVWVSCSLDLFRVAEEDFKDIHSDVPIMAFTPKCHVFQDGVLFCTYAMLSKHFQQIINFLGTNFDGVVCQLLLTHIKFT